MTVVPEAWFLFVLHTRSLVFVRFAVLCANFVRALGSLL